MHRGRNTESGLKPSDDIGWKFATPTGNKGEMNCNFCGRKITGGITRLKQHLAHISGQISSCPKVPAEVRKEMHKIIQEFQLAKKDKIKKEKELEEEIMQMNEPNMGEDDDEENIELEYARHQSLRQFSEDAFRRSRGAQYDTGDSSQHQEKRQGLGRSFTVREKRSEDIRYAPTSTPYSRLNAIEIEIEKEKFQSKQPKLNTKWFKQQKAKLLKAFGNFVVHNRLPFSIVDSPWTRPLLRTVAEVGPNIPPPTPYEIAEVFLPNEYRLMKKYIASFNSIWKERGVTIMCDGWSGSTRMHIINFLIYSNSGTVFHKSVDASLVTSRDADYYFGLMKGVVNEIGSEKVVQIVTDNEAAMKAGGKKLMDEFPHLYWTACSAHCIDLILEDIGKRKKVAEVVEQARLITQFIYNHNWICNYMKKFTNGRNLLRPGVTRFATNFIALESIVRHKIGLRNMFESEGWLASKFGKATSGPAFEVKRIILGLSSEGKKFWEKANEVISIEEPLLKVLRLVDGDEKPTMGFIYEAMERAKLAIKQNCRSHVNYWRIIDQRWNFQLHQDLHAAGYFLNPQFQYGAHDIGNDKEVMLGLKKVIQKLEPNLDNQAKALNQVMLFRHKMESFGSTLAQRAIKFTNPAEWWIQYGESAPELQTIAIKVLSQTTSASNCERNWSTFSLIHTKTRNRLRYQKLHSLVFVHYNMRLKIRNATRKNRKELEKSYNPINLDYIFEEDDPLSPWLEERESPLLDGQDNAWLSDDEEINASQSQAQGQETSGVGNESPIGDNDDDDDDDGSNDDDDDNGSNADDNDPSSNIGGCGATVGSTSHEKLNYLNQSDDAPHHHYSTHCTYQRSQGQSSGDNQFNNGVSGDAFEKGKSIAHAFSEAYSYDPNAYGGYDNWPPGLMYTHSLVENSSTSSTTNYEVASFGLNYYGSHSSFPHMTTENSLYSHESQDQSQQEDNQYQDPPRHSFWW